MLRRVALVRTDVSEELSVAFIRVTSIGELGTMLAVTSNRRALRSVLYNTQNHLVWGWGCVVDSVHRSEFETTRECFEHWICFHLQVRRRLHLLCWLSVVQLLRLALSKGPNRLLVMLAQDDQTSASFFSEVLMFLRSWNENNVFRVTGFLNSLQRP
jgi:hypothetical protein